MNKLLVILGPTATGKSDLAVKLAEKFNGEVISADSRQVYKDLNIGTGKITKKEMLGVPHHMLDIASPKKTFTVSEWQKQTKILLEEITSRGKIPIICGGTGFYIQSIVDGTVLPEVPPNLLLRKKLEKKTLVELVQILKKLDPIRLKNIDSKNPVRMIRAIEIASALGKVPELKTIKNNYDILQIGINLPEKKLKHRIHNRLTTRFKKGMIKEAENLHKKGLSFKRMKSLGLEYKHLALYLEKRIKKEDLVKNLEKEIWHYAKRQMTWFKRDQKIRWFLAGETAKIEKAVNQFL